MPGTEYTEMIMIVPNFSKYCCIVFGFVGKTQHKLIVYHAVRWVK